MLDEAVVSILNLYNLYGTIPDCIIVRLYVITNTFVSGGLTLAVSGERSLPNNTTIILGICYRLRDYLQTPVYGLCAHAVITHELCHMMSPQELYRHMHKCISELQ